MTGFVLAPEQRWPLAVAVPMWRAATLTHRSATSRIWRGSFCATALAPQPHAILRLADQRPHGRRSSDGFGGKFGMMCGLSSPSASARALRLYATLPCFRNVRCVLLMAYALGVPGACPVCGVMFIPTFHLETAITESGILPFHYPHSGTWCPPLETPLAIFLLTVEFLRALAEDRRTLRFWNLTREPEAARAARESGIWNLGF